MSSFLPHYYFAKYHNHQLKFRLQSNFHKLLQIWLSIEMEWLTWKCGKRTLKKIKFVYFFAKQLEKPVATGSLKSLSNEDTENTALVYNKQFALSNWARCFTCMSRAAMSQKSVSLALSLFFKSELHFNFRHSPSFSRNLKRMALCGKVARPNFLTAWVLFRLGLISNTHWRSYLIWAVILVCSNYLYLSTTYRAKFSTWILAYMYDVL